MMFQRAKPTRPLRTLAPACIVAVAYVDPGNFGVNITAGATHGYSLVWVVILASVMAALVQYLAAKLGVATNRSLAENCRADYGVPTRVALWLQAELVVIMTDLAELVGGAIALRMLTGLPLVAGALVVALISSFVLVLRVRGHEGFEPVVLGLLLALLLAMAYQVAVAGVDVADLVAGTVPSAMDTPAVLLAAGIIGATVMPHALHLHSALARPGLGHRADDAEARRAGRNTRRSVVIAMTVAGLTNISIMLVAARLPGGIGDDLDAAQLQIGQVAGRTAAVLIAVALLVSGLASTVVGVYTGQLVMQGFMKRPISMWLRRGLALIPPLALLVAGVNSTQALVLSQVVLAFTLPGTLIPLVLFTARRSMMGGLTNRVTTTVVAAAITAFITGLDLYLLVVTFA